MLRKKRKKHFKSPKKGSPKNPTIIGFLHKKGKKDYIISGEKKYLVTGQKEDVGELVYNSKYKAVLRSKGKFKEPAVFLLRLLEVFVPLEEKILNILEEANAPSEFPKKCLNEATAFGNRVKKEHKKNRTDYTSLSFCTIDGKTAKDFDDAVFAQKHPKGIHVFVAIADVSHYVKKNSALDHEAFQRGASLYYPGKCTPMLPHTLSDGLCSLKPNVVRLAICVSFVVSKSGKVSNENIEQTFFKSAARLTYEEVDDFLQKKTVKKITTLADISKSLQHLTKASSYLRSDRVQRGAIDFDISESVVSLDKKGQPIAINPLKRLESHKLIEDLMVATNEVVARFCLKKQLPSIFRVHEPPSYEKFSAFVKTAKAFNAIPKQERLSEAKLKDPYFVQSIMSSYQNSRHKDILNTLMLRAMMPAHYSHENLMHFGLASKAYLHFTSPIRRYADLIVHRQIRSLLFDKQPPTKSQKVLEKIALAISERESDITDIERKIQKAYSCFFMREKIGETYESTVISCTEFGFFVRIKKHHVEGLVHISSISKNSRITFIPETQSLIDESSKRKILVGDKALVKLLNVNVERGFIDFELVNLPKK